MDFWKDPQSPPEGTGGWQKEYPGYFLSICAIGNTEGSVKKKGSPSVAVKFPDTTARAEGNEPVTIPLTFASRVTDT